ncbi:MAG: sulfurtransferase [Acidimicrobiales bacterium mtb01]|nr:rhodanese-like domain-containing protein [Actinomycetota bacterium]TEX45243.1 MAG: sulfurtransferase [Acidimicrobiales bacterium mtb01]
MIKEVDVAELASLGTVPLIDVREPDEYSAGHVRGAVLVPLGTIPSADLSGFRGSTLYVICKSGGRSMRACEFLADAGFDVVNIAGGTMAWVASGREVVEGSSPS